MPVQFAPTGETPVCVLDPSYKNGCEINEPDQAQYCAPNPGPCDRSTNFTNSFNDQETYYSDTREEDQKKTNSLVFNTFIWLQVRAVSCISDLQLLPVPAGPAICR